MENDYEELKSKGLVKILNTGTNYALSYKQFNQYGEVLPDKVLSVNDEALKKEKVTLQARITEIDSFLTDLEESPEVIK